MATILAFLSPDLASQISNRKSFYKEEEGGEEPDVTRNAQALECDVRLWAAAPPRFEDAVLVRDHIIHVSTKGVQGDMAWSSRDIHPFRSGRMQW